MTSRNDPSSTPPPPRVPLDLPIGARIAAAIDRFGEIDTIDLAIALLAGSNAGDEFLLYVGGEHAQGVLAGAPPLYWPELWGARTLLYVWSDSAVPAVTVGLTNQAWRVREMCVRVAVARELAVADILITLLSDASPRVRAAAVRAIATLGSAEHSDNITPMVRDSDRDVRRAAQDARDALRSRFPRDPEAARTTE